MGLRATLIRDRLHGFRAASGSDLQPGTPTAAGAGSSCRLGLRAGVELGGLVNWV